jgi:hypothetical protein
MPRLHFVVKKQGIERSERKPHLPIPEIENKLRSADQTRPTGACQMKKKNRRKKIQ